MTINKYYYIIKARKEDNSILNWLKTFLEVKNMKNILKGYKVKNMESSNGNTVPNQFIIETPSGMEIFQSYETIIAIKKDGAIYLDSNYWNYSVTTGKYRNIFLMEDKKETEKKIKSGQYILTDLN